MTRLVARPCACGCRWETRRDGLSSWPRRSSSASPILFEATYLTLIFALTPLATIAVWLRWPEDPLGIDPNRYDTFALYAYSVIGGVLGGTLFDIKWLYHSVAHGRWNRDRRLWRLMTPVIAGALAFGMLLLGTADLVPLLDTEQLRKPEAAMGVSFLIGYFSDNTIGAMARLANGLLGEQEPVKSHHRVDPPGGPETKS